MKTSKERGSTGKGGFLGEFLERLSWGDGELNEYFDGHFSLGGKCRMV